MECSFKLIELQKKNGFNFGTEFKRLVEFVGDV